MPSARKPAEADEAAILMPEKEESGDRTVLSAKWLRGRNEAGSSLVSISLRSIIFGFAFWGLFDLSARGLEWSRNALVKSTPACYCGTSDAEAIVMGCVYDPLAVDWLPPSCVDEELVEEFDAAGPGGAWPYYEFINTTWPIYNFVPFDTTEIDAFARDGKAYYATREWHILHCMYTWKKQFRFRSGEKSVEPWNEHEEHIQHCQDYIMEAVREKQDLDVVETIILGVDRHKKELEDLAM